MAKRPFGICHICGRETLLSYEHVPPEKAFNNKRTIYVQFEKAISLGPGENVKGPINQRGAGSYTLCEKCNNDTGHWYGNKFVDWCYQGMDILIKTRGNPSLFYLSYLFPLPILKQIITMFFSVNSNSFRNSNEELVRFILNKESKYLSPRYQFFVYYNIDNTHRYSGVSGILDVNTNKSCVLSEISYPPFGYVMTIDSDPPDNRLVEITHFSKFDYKEFVIMDLKLPVLHTQSIMPGVY